MDLVLNLHDSLPSSLVWCGKSGRKLCKLSPSTATTVDVSLLPLAPGLHVRRCSVVQSTCSSYTYISFHVAFFFQTISGIRLTDSFLKRTYEHDDVTQIYVYDSCDGVS